MAWVILGLGAALAATGAVALWSGVSYMPVEWGWSQIIAGATAISGGVMTIGLAGVIHRLGSLRTAMLALAAAQPLPREAASEDGGSDEVATPDDETEEPSQEDPETGPSEEQTPLRPRLRRAGARPPEDDTQLVTPAAPSRGRRVGIGDIGSVEALPPRADAVEAEPRSRVATIADPELPLPAVSSPDVASTRPDADADTDAEALSVVGRYEAGGASYALFSDGTIEVETDGGTHRFGSMEELKAFLERHDRADQPSE